MDGIDGRRCGGGAGDKREQRASTGVEAAYAWRREKMYCRRVGLPQREQQSGDSKAPFSIPEARVQAARAANAGRQGEGEATSSPPVRKKVAGEEKRDWSSPLVQWLCSPAETKKRGSREV